MITYRLEELMKQHDLTDREVMERVRGSSTTLTAMKKAKIKRIPVAMLEDLCVLFNCDITDIIILEKEDRHVK